MQLVRVGDAGACGWVRWCGSTHVAVAVRDGKVACLVYAAAAASRVCSLGTSSTSHVYVAHDAAAEYVLSSSCGVLYSHCRAEVMRVLCLTVAVLSSEEQEQICFLVSEEAVSLCVAVLAMYSSC
jgi:hypothetical protein